MKKTTRLLVFTMFFCLMSGCSQYLNERREARTKATEEAIKESPQLQELDKLCRELPLVKDFALISKDKSYRKVPKLSFHYYSDIDFNLADKEFRKYFEENGWEHIEVNTNNIVREYENDKFVVNIQYGGMGSDTNYGISCGKREF